MLLKKITLTNFRPFKGKHEIEFSIDKERNVTLIMAKSGAGKTTLEQAFQWCLYGKAEAFSNKSVLNSIVEKEMQKGESIDVSVKLEIEHNDIEYTIIRKEVYTKNINNDIKQNTPELEVYLKKSDGKTIVNNYIKNKATINSILPESLSKYFFFDGERINTMALNVVNGEKTAEFKIAVQNILGLTALLNATEHLKPTKDGVIGRYNAKMDAEGGKDTKQKREEIENENEKIEKNNLRIESIEEELRYYSNEIERAKKEIESYTDVEEMQKRLNELNYKLIKEKETKNIAISRLMRNFYTSAYGFMSRKLINDAINELKNADEIDKDIPGVTADTIKHLIEGKKCICGSDLSNPTSEAVQNLTALLKYVPPQFLGTSIKQFKQFSAQSIKNSENYFLNIEAQFSSVRSSSIKIGELEYEIGELDNIILKSSNAKVADLKNRQMNMEKHQEELIDEMNNIKIQNGISENNIANAEAELSRLQLKIKRNREIEEQLIYAKEVYRILKQTYENQEEKTRISLENQINNLFKKIYSGGMTIKIDDKYRITHSVNKLEENTTNIDANTARAYSIIFAFIVGIINLAKQKINENEEESNIITDEYPLVMDAPLSSFDEKRIKNICEVIPNIARQVIIFIKDVDGNIAKEEMKNKIKIEYEVALKNEEMPLDSSITKVGEY